MLIRFTKLFSNLTTLEKNVTKLFILKIELFSSPGPNPIKLTKYFYNDKCAFVIFLFTFQQAVKLSTIRSFFVLFQRSFQFYRIDAGQKNAKKDIKGFLAFLCLLFPRLPLLFRRIFLGEFIPLFSTFLSHSSLSLLCV